MFLDLVQALTKKPLTGEAWIADLKEPLVRNQRSTTHLLLHCLDFTGIGCRV